MNNFEIYITMNVESPNFEDFANAISELYKLGIKDESKIGIMLTKMQLVNFKVNLSLFEMRTVNPVGLPNQIMGFPVKIVQFEEIYK